MHRSSAKVGCYLAALMATFLICGAAGFTGADGTAPERSKELSFALMFVYAGVALFFSFLCSVAEAVVLSISPSYLANMEKKDPHRAAQLRKVKEGIDRSLAAILTLNTIAHTVGAGGAGAEANAFFEGKYIGLTMGVLTLLILFFSEIIPKTLGALYWRSLAPITGQFVQLLVWVLFPLILVSELVTKWLARGKSVHQFSREEFAAMAEVGAQAGHLDPNESRVLRNLFRLQGLCAEDIMTPRTVVFSLHEELTVAEVLKVHPEISYSRIPIYADDRDHVTGFVLKSDMLLEQHNHDGVAKLRDLKREIRGIRNDVRLSRVLEDLLDNRAHILLVVDEYGGMDGIVTLEDVVETLMGIEIVDEADKIDDMRRLARQKWEERMRRVGIDVRESDEAPSPDDSDDQSD